MAATGIIGCRGLYTDPSPVSPPPGGMRVCDEVIIDAPGVATARPCFVPRTTKPGTNFRPRHVAAYGAQAVSISTDGATWRAETETAVLTGEAAPPSVGRGGTQFAELRGRLYLTTTDGVRVMPSEDAAALETAGMHEPGMAIISAIGGAGWLADGSLVAYRIAFLRASEGFVTRSAPSPWTFVQNATGAGSNISVSVPLPAYVEAGDVIEVYRSLAVTSGTPADVMYLSVRHVVTAGDVTAGIVSITDSLSESQLGQALYTSSTREGIEGRNTPPPRAFAIAAHQNSLWAASVRYPHTIVVDLVTAWTAPSAFTGSVSAGVNEITGAGPPVNVRAGQLVTSSGGAFPANTRVLGVAGNKVTLTANALVTGPGYTLEFADVVEVEGVEYYAWSSASNPATRFFRVWNVPGNPGASAFLTARELAYVVSAHSTTVYAQAVEDVSTSVYERTGRLIFRRADFSTTAFIFEPLALEPFFSSPDPDVVGATLQSEQLTRPNRIAFSKPLEPESFRDLDWLELGREDAHVLALADIDDALLVFKEDGIWSVFGTWPIFSAERVSEARIVSGDAVDVIDGRAIARTDRGVLEVTASGVAANLSDGRIRDDIVGETGVRVSFVRAWPTLGLVLVAVTEPLGISASAVYCLHLATGEWSRWTIPVTSVAWSAADRAILAAWDVPGAWELRSSVDSRGYDAEYEIATWALDASDVIAVAEADIGSWIPKAGDIVETSAVERARVVSVTQPSSTDFVLQLDRALATGSDADPLAVYESVVGRLEWQRHGMSLPSTGGFVREIQVHLDQSGAGASLMTAMRLVAGGTDERSATRSTLVATPLVTEVYSRPVRFGVSRQVARSTHFYPYVEIAESYAWRVLGVALVGKAVSTRVSR